MYSNHIVLRFRVYACRICFGESVCHRYQSARGNSRHAGSFIGLIQTGAVRALLAVDSRFIITLNLCFAPCVGVILFCACVRPCPRLNCDERTEYSLKRYESCTRRRPRSDKPHSRLNLKPRLVQTFLQSEYWSVVSPNAWLARFHSTDTLPVSPARMHTLLRHG